MCLFSDPLSLKVAWSSGSDMFGGEECFEDDIIYRWIDRVDVLQSIFTSLRLYMCTLANRQLSRGVQVRERIGGQIFQLL